MSVSTMDQIAQLSGDISPWAIISGVLGILGFIISVINIASYFWRNRVNFEVTILKYDIQDYIGGEIRLFVAYMLSNKSQLPLAVTDVKIIANGNSYPPDKQSHIVGHYKYIESGITIDSKITYNSYPPISLSSLGAESGYFVYILPRETQLDFVRGMNFEIDTNRSLAVKTKLAPMETVEICRCKIPRKASRDHSA